MFQSPRLSEKPVQGRWDIGPQIANLPHTAQEDMRAWCTWGAAFGIAAVRLSRCGVPGPYLRWVKEVKVVFQFAGAEFLEIAPEVSINVVRVVLILRGRTIPKDFADAILPELVRKSPKVVDQLFSPGPGHPGQRVGALP